MKQLKRLADIPSQLLTPMEPPKPQEPKPLRDRNISQIGKSVAAIFKPRREIVAGGVVKWKPINKQAALLLSKGEPMKGMIRENLITGSTIQHYDRTISIAGKLITYSKKMSDNIKQFTEDVIKSRRYLEEATDMFRTDVLKFIEELPETIKKVRSFRMTIAQEKDLTLSALGDLRKFFLDKDYEEEMRRLREFVAMAERLKKLSDDGTLNAISDVMIKLTQP